MKEKKRTKGSRVLIALAVVLALLAVLAFWQRNNLKAVLDFASHSQEELEEKLQQNDQQIKDTVDALEDVTVRDLTEEERQALRDGSLSPEEITNRLVGWTPDLLLPVQPETPPASSASGEQPPAASSGVNASGSAGSGSDSSGQPPTEDNRYYEYQQKLSALIARVYVLREEYLIALDNLQAEAIEDYRNLSSSQKKGSKLADFISKYLSRGTQLEKDCDRKMDAVVREMEAVIKEYGGDMSLVDTVVTTYANEKSLKKAWYMSELEKRGFI